MQKITKKIPVEKQKSHAWLAALLHSNEVNKAEIDQLHYRVANIEGALKGQRIFFASPPIKFNYLRKILRHRCHQARVSFQFTSALPLTIYFVTSHIIFHQACWVGTQYF